MQSFLDLIVDIAIRWQEHFYCKLCLEPSIQLYLVPTIAAEGTYPIYARLWSVLTVTV